MLRLTLINFGNYSLNLVLLLSNIKYLEILKIVKFSEGFVYKERKSPWSVDADATLSSKTNLHFFISLTNHLLFL